MKIKRYWVYTRFSSREIQARSKREAKVIFRKQLGSLISSNDEIKIEELDFKYKE